MKEDSLAHDRTVQLGANAIAEAVQEIGLRIPPITIHFQEQPIRISRLGYDNMIQTPLLCVGGIN
jgi:hypothetical protein